MAHGHIKMSKSGAVESIALGVSSGVQRGYSDSADRVTMRLGGTSKHGDNVFQTVWMTQAEAVQLAANLLMSAWELDTTGALNSKAKEFVEVYYEDPTGANLKHKMVRALKAR